MADDAGRPDDEEERTFGDEEREANEAAREIGSRKPAIRPAGTGGADGPGGKS